MPGAYTLDLEPHRDNRGWFARSYCEREFHDHGLHTEWVQNNISFNAKRATLRGMHFQKAPHEEPKLVQVTRGGIFDVLIDMRPESPTFTNHVTIEMTAANHRMIYIPPRVAHGFLTLEDDTEVLYHMGAFYAPECAAGLRYDDLAFAIAWPEAPQVISERDATYPDFSIKDFA